MKRFLAPFFLVLAAAIVVLILIASRSVYSPSMTALATFLRYYNTVAHALVVRGQVKAQYPARFTVDMSGPVSGDTSYFIVDHRLSNLTQQGNVRPPPYPPQEMSCVLLGTDQGDVVVFLALHSDMYRAEWLVHEARYPWPSDELKATLAIVGCEISP